MSVWVDQYSICRERKDLARSFIHWPLMLSASLISVLVPWLVLGFEPSPALADTLEAFGGFLTTFAALATLVVLLLPTVGVFEIHHTNAPARFHWSRWVKIFSRATSLLAFGIVLLVYSAHF